jgi:hypothetical protein
LTPLSNPFKQNKKSILEKLIECPGGRELVMHKTWSKSGQNNTSRGSLLTPLLSDMSDMKGNSDLPASATNSSMDGALDAGTGCTSRSDQPAQWALI